MTAQDKITAHHKNVFCAIAAAQLEFGSVTKGSTNPAFRSKYADLSDVASVVIPTLARHGVCVLHYLTGDDLGSMRTEFVHGETESRIHCDVPLIVSKNDMQGMKSATTYAKRIGLESLSGVAPDDDDGNAAAKAPPKAETRTVTPDQFVKLRDKMEESGADEKQFLAHYKAQSLQQFPLNAFADAMVRLDKKIAANAKPNADLDGDTIPQHEEATA